ncbi:chemotaxis protein methyltransferase CheR [Catalinimonas alkaloidigena]|uniref:Chemotaxis protein methyltransferase CheR n=1 Tax=Catalinimonas alkaloidigena TaxID=1075417 RepID=A0A1G9BRV1_9BACT|nr:protein-glutamate O-methyltransferase CheR [Catalinimonas alkaloidigena]SDK42176.1 chemotaxis protein methyltransferase CheR [Catalinimonas alkaloidigena]
MVDITDEELVSLTRAINDRYGLDFTNYEKKSLRRGFGRLISRHHLGSTLGLWGKILRDREFFPQCVDELTVGLTEMFRNSEAWVAVRDQVLPNLYTNPLRIWHSGCSTGEEIYTMAIVLKDKHLLSRAKAVATDLSATALEQAKQGTYPLMTLNRYAKAMRAYRPEAQLEHYFDIDGEEGTIRDMFKRHITFRRHNLVCDPSVGQFEMVFCRNVMIYFDETLKMKALRLFHESLVDGGFLIIGYYDLMPAQAQELFELFDPKTRIYRKKN